MTSVTLILIENFYKVIEDLESERGNLYVQVVYTVVNSQHFKFLL